MKKKNEPGYPYSWLTRVGPNLWYQLLGGFEPEYMDNECRPVWEPTSEDFFDDLAPFPDDEKSKASRGWRDNHETYADWQNDWDKAHPRYRDKKTGQLWYEHFSDGIKILPLDPPSAC